MKKLVLTLVVMLMVVSVAMALTLPRNETFYEGGAMWGPLTNFNPLNSGNFNGQREDVCAFHNP